MSTLSQPGPGQRWRSRIDGHAVLIDDLHGDVCWVRYEGTHLATAIDPADFFDDYEFVEISASSTSRVAPESA